MTTKVFSNPRTSIEDAYERIQSFIRRTPVEHSNLLSEKTGAHVHLKLENTQITGSFKVRGALNKVLISGSKDAGIVAASTGNHGAGVAYASRQIDCPATIFVPTVIAEEKLSRIYAYGAHVIRSGEDCVESEAAAREHAETTGALFISPYNDSHVIAGQGTLGYELVEQIPDCDVVYVALGGGGLISGIGHYLKSIRPHTEIVACSPINSCVMHQSLEAGKLLDLPSLPTLSDSTAGGVEEGSITFELCQAVVDRSLTVSEEEITQSMVTVLGAHSTLIEGAAAAAVAGCTKDADNLRGKSACVVLCGANIPVNRLSAVLNDLT